MRIQMLRNAEQSLDIVYHAIQEGEASIAFLGEVLAAAERGVQVRIILDGKVGAVGNELKVLRTLVSHPNISCKMYNPISLLKPWEWNSVFHDKFIIVDHEFLLLGGRNIGDRYYNPENYEGEVTNDRDVLVWKTTDNNESALDQTADYMELLWQSKDCMVQKGRISDTSKYQSLIEKALLFEMNNPDYYVDPLDAYLDRMVTTSKITLIYNPINTTKKEPWVGYHLKELTMHATKSVILQTPYSTANSDLLDVLEQIPAEVMMLTNSTASSPNLPAFSNYYSQRQKFIDTGISIYEFQSSDSIHGKSLVIDEKISVVGSFNMDDRSLYIDTETMLVIDSPEFAGVLLDAINHYKEQSLLVGTDNQYVLNEEVTPVPVSGLKKATMKVVSVFSRIFQFLI